MNMKRGFTLVEILITLAIVAVLSSGVILVLQPQELLKQSRDTRRLTEINTIHSAINIVQVDIPDAPMGTSSTVYTSLVDLTATSTSGTNCATMGLPALPSGYTWHCAASSTVSNIDGTGWIPINFASLPSRSPLSALPVDPVNTTSSSNYYTYIAGGSWEITAILEARKNRTFTHIPRVATVGTHTGLTPGIRGDMELRGYWSFNASSGNTVSDSGPYGNHGTKGGGSWVTGKVGNGLSLPNANINVPDASSLQPSSGITVAIWIKTNENNGYRKIMVKSNIDNLVYYLSQGPSGSAAVYFGVANNSGSSASGLTNQDLPIGQWVHLAGTYDGSKVRLYWNGVEVGSGTLTGTVRQSAGPFYIGSYQSGGETIDATIDEAYLYGRALSANEILALYNATR